MEADPRNAEQVIEQLGLLMSKAVTTPGVDDQEEAKEHAYEALDPQAANAFRGIAARCNYLAGDRPDIMYPAKELCRRMSSPTSRSMLRLKRVNGYLQMLPRLSWRYDWQAPVYMVDVNTDANPSRCKLSRKSTSGGTIR